MPNSKLILSADNLSKSFHNGKEEFFVLKEVNLKVYSGEFLAIRGASGSGKSTLLSLLAGLALPTSGNIFLDGNPLSGMSETELSLIRRDKVGFIFQAFHLIPSLTVVENTCLPLSFRNNSFPIEKGKELLKQVGMDHRCDFFPDQLSGGERQRAAIARSMINNPVVIFADEPTGNLDSKTGDIILDLLEDHTKRVGKTLVLVTHDEHIAARANRQVYLKDGRLLESKE